MIGANSLAYPPKWQSLADLSEVGKKPLGTSTDACIAKGATRRVYPRAATAITIRTPSPDGQSDMSQPRLPVFLMFSVFGLLANRHEDAYIGLTGGVEQAKGQKKCKSRTTYWRYSPARHLRLAARLSANKQLAARRSVQVQRSLPTTTLPKVLHLVLQVMSRTANCTRTIVANSAPAGVVNTIVTVQAACLRGVLPCDPGTGHPDKYQKRTAHVH